MPQLLFRLRFSKLSMISHDTIFNEHYPGLMQTCVDTSTDTFGITGGSSK